MKALAGSANLVDNYSTVSEAFEYSTEDGFPSFIWLAVLVNRQLISALDCLRGEKQLWLAGAHGKVSAKNQEDGWVDSFCGT